MTRVGRLTAVRDANTRAFDNLIWLSWAPTFTLSHTHTHAHACTHTLKILFKCKSDWPVFLTLYFPT